MALKEIRAFINKAGKEKYHMPLDQGVILALYTTANQIILQDNKFGKKTLDFFVDRM